MPSRRDFAKFVLAGGAGMLAPRELFSAPAEVPAAPQSVVDDKFDLLVEGGTVIDPSQNLNGAFDVAIKAGKILEVSKSISKDRALKTVSAKGRIVTPGFIDMHAHAYDGRSIGRTAER
jgi:imidazolonepropionase-like amidohydrolase